MTTIAGFTRTGRQLLGPGSDLIEVQAADGMRYTAIVFHPEYHSHNAINAALSVVLSYLESPMVSGLADLIAQDREQAAFIYATGQAWSVAEVIRTLSDLGESGGPRAGLELLVQVGTVLVEAAESGEGAGVYSHGGLTPWRVMLDAEGQINVIGHALPQVEILVFRDSPERIPREDAFRYCPPERMESRGENFTSDLFGLGLMAFELMTGRPVYDGLINDIRTKAARGETSRRLQQFKEALPQTVRDLLVTTLRPELRDRFQSGDEFLEAASEALRDGTVTGASLREVMQRVARHQPRSRQELDPGRTAMLTKEEMKRLAREEDDAPPPKPVRTQFVPTPSVGSVPPPRAVMRAAPEPAAALPTPTPLPPPATALPAARRPPRLAGTQSVDTPPPPPPPPTLGAARLPPGRRPVGDPPPLADTRAVVQILGESGNGAAAARERVQRAMQATGAAEVAPPPPVPPPPPIFAKAVPPTVSVEFEDDPPTGPGGRTPTPTPPPPPPAQVAVPAPAPDPVAQRPAPPAPPPPSPTAAVSGAPIALRAPCRGEAVAVRFARAPGLRGHRRRLPGDTSLAEAAQQLIGQIVPLALSTEGRLLGWYRIGTETGILPVDSTVGSLDDEANHPLHFVENRLEWLRVEFSSGSLRLAVGMAVPIASLKDALVTQLQLPDGNWQLTLNGVALDDFHILADHPITPSSVLALRPAPG